MGLAKELFERRVPHALVIYAGASFGLVEFTSFMVDEFLLSPHWTRVVLSVCALLLPSVLMLAWFHGRQGRDEVPLVEKIGVPANLVLVVGVVALVFGGRDLGAATTAVTVETEDGETVERVVPKAEFRKRTALFPFDPSPGLGEDEAWLAYMVPFAVQVDLSADEFFEPMPAALFATMLWERGFPTLLDVPLSLKREVAEDVYTAFIVAGEIDHGDGTYRLTLTLHETDSGAQISETVHEGPDVLALVDEMSVALADALEIPERDGVEDLPARERLTGNDAAWASFGRGLAALLVEPPDMEAALEALRAATTLDPTFTLAQYQLSTALLLSNRPAEAVPAIQAAMDHLYRLPERFQFPVKSDYYFVTQQAEKAWAVVEMWVELHPEDPLALRNYALVQRLRGDFEGLIGTLERLYRLNPAERSLLTQIANLHVELGNTDEAAETLARYVEQFPEDYTGYASLAGLERRRGAHGAAREYLERAIILEPVRPELTSRLARLDLEVGRFEEALAGHERALDLARGALQQAEALEDLTGYYRFRGQMEEAIRTAAVRLEELASVMTPLEHVREQFERIDLLVETGRPHDAARLFEELEGRLQPPLSNFVVPRWRIRVELGADDADAARAAYHAAFDAMEAIGFGASRAGLIGDLGRIDELAGDYESAVLNYRESMALDGDRNMHRQIGSALRNAGRLEEAEAELREALRLRPADPRAHFEMARVLEARGDASRAVEHLQSALAAWEPADDTFEPARDARAKLTELRG